MSTESVKEFVAFSLGLAFIATMVFWTCSGCLPQPVAANLENAAAVAQYKVLLQPCRERARMAREAGADPLDAYAIYEACADQVDAELCRTSSVRCEGGL